MKNILQMAIFLVYIQIVVTNEGGHRGTARFERPAQQATEP